MLATIDGWPAGIAANANGDVFISNFSLGYVHKINADGELSVFVDDARVAGCVGIVFDDAGNLLLGNYVNGSIYSVSTAGEVSLIAQIPGLPNNFAVGYINYFEGHVYATGIGNHQVYKVSLDGTISHFAGTGTSGSSDGTALHASFSNPNGIGVDKVNRYLYIQDWGDTKLRRIELLEE